MLCHPLNSLIILVGYILLGMHSAP